MFEISPFGSDRVRRVSKCHGSGRFNRTRPPDPQEEIRPVKSPNIFWCNLYGCFYRLYFVVCILFDLLRKTYTRVLYICMSESSSCSFSPAEDNLKTGKAGRGFYPFRPCVARRPPECSSDAHNDTDTLRPIFSFKI